MKPYEPVPDHVRERMQIAILTGERLQLHWADEVSSRAYMANVEPLELMQRDGRDYLKALSEDRSELLIRLDLIRNLPTPVK
ncbi:MAG: hypothetical protein PVI15_02900 [Chromatiales bacterium]|jgi:predicted DNA-binding transcriptional regulator YafY